MRVNDITEPIRHEQYPLRDVFQSKTNINSSGVNGVSETTNETSSNPVNPQSQTLKTDKLEMTSSEMKIQSQFMKQKEIQNQITERQSQLSSLRESVQGLKELSGQLENAGEGESKEVENQLNEMVSQITQNPLIKDQVNIQDSMKNLNAISLSSVEDFTNNVESHVQSLESDVTKEGEKLMSMFTGSEISSKEFSAKDAMEKFKTSLIESDPSELSSNLDFRRSNVSYLLQ